MSGSTRAITLTLDVRGAEAVQTALRQIGPVGEEALRRLDAAAQKSAAGTRQATQATTQFAAANENAGQSARGYGSHLQNVGFQVQDFAVQVQGGTSALTAFAQQAPQLLGAFGTAGALAGAAVAVGAIAISVLSARDNVAELNKANEAWKKVQGEINDLLLTAVERTARLRAATVANATGTLMGTMTEAAFATERNGVEIMNRERVQARLQADLAAASPRNRAGIEADIRENEVALASARAQSDAAGKRAAEARRQLDLLRATGPEEFGPPAPSGAGEIGRGTRALLQSRDDLADARRIAGLSPTQRPIEEARIKAEREAENLNITGLEREELIRNRLAEATARQATASGKAAEAEANRLRNALQGGATEILRSTEQLELARSLAAAETPREALLAKQRAEIERTTVSIRARAEVETNPAIKAALEKQIEQITRLRREAAALEETTRNRSALFNQQQRLDAQGAERDSTGMGTVERARFLAQFQERQRLSAEGADPGSEQAIERIRRAGEIAVGDEALRRVKEYTGAVQEIGSAFSDAFTKGIFEGKKLGDVFRDLDKQIAQIIFRALVMKPFENALSGIAGSIGSSIGRYFGGGAPAAPAAAPTYGGLYANGGIMSPFGDVPLRKYAGGGIANSPQVALFGEGSMSEAYVPLPDGRRIPVKMQGGGGTTVMIDARGAEIGVEARIEAGIRRAIPGIVSITKGSLAGDVNRGGRMAQTFGRRAA